MVNEIALMFTNTTQRQLYQEAAADFRLPYWDWSLEAPKGETHLPNVFWSPVIQQYGPNGVQNIKNPLYSYHFHPLDQEALIWNPVRYLPRFFKKKTQLNRHNSSNNGMKRNERQTLH